MVTKNWLVQHSTATAYYDVTCEAAVTCSAFVHQQQRTPCGALLTSVYCATDLIVGVENHDVTVDEVFLREVDDFVDGESA